jgi:hypothetical protein
LLIWRKRSIENYFLDIEWLSKSTLFVPTKRQYLVEKLERVARDRLFLDAANLTIVTARGTLFKNSIKFDSDLQRYRTLAEGLAALLARPEWKSTPKTIAKNFAPHKVKASYGEIVAEMLGPGMSAPRYGYGTWADKMDAKPLSEAVFNSSAFRVPSISGIRKLTAREKRSAIIRDLIESSPELPNDFVELRKMLAMHLSRSD